MLSPKYQFMAILLGTVLSVPFGKWPKMEQYWAQCGESSNQPTAHIIIPFQEPK